MWLFASFYKRLKSLFIIDKRKLSHGWFLQDKSFNRKIVKEVISGKGGFFKFKMLWIKFSWFTVLLGIFGSLIFLVTLYPQTTQQIIFGQSANWYREGMIGQVQSVNPLLQSTNSIDEDIKRLIFNKLVRVDPSGEIFPDLATTWNITEDGKVYTFFLDPNVTWQDDAKTPFTADDVIFTYNILKEQTTKTLLSEALKKITLEKIDKQTVKFILSSQNALFMELTNVYIAPKHLLKDKTFSQITLNDHFNEKPIGTGRYMLTNISPSQIILQANKDYFRSVPHIKTISIDLFATEEEAIYAFKTGRIDAISNVTKTSKQALADYKNLQTRSIVLTNRSRVLYLNMQSGNLLSSRKLRQAISSGINRKEITVLFPGSKVSVGPIATTSWAYSDKYLGYVYNTKKAITLLEQEQWVYPKGKENPQFRQQRGKVPTITLTYLNNERNTLIANQIKQDLATIGLKIIFDPQPFDVLSEQIIPTRNFEILLFEVATNIDPDRYALWHSNSIEHPGLNVVSYKNNRVDILLERGRTTVNRTKRKQDYALFQKYIQEDTPAIYLYHPVYNYIYDRTRVVLPTQMDIVSPSDRLNHIEDWQLVNLAN